MLQHDYLLEVIGRFVEAVSTSLRGALCNGDFARVGEVERAVGELLDLDAQTAMALSPQSLVTMMTLSGVGESVAAYAAYALDKVALAYERQGDDAEASLRRAGNRHRKCFPCGRNHSRGVYGAGGGAVVA